MLSKARALCCLVLTAFLAPALAEPGVSDGTILLGQSAALSGPAQQLGLELRQGAKAYFDAVNASGGIFERKVELLSLDDGYEPERTAVNTRKLVSEHRVFALFGFVGTPTSQAAMPIFLEARVPYFGAFSGAQLLRAPFSRYIFNVRASYFDETEKIVEQLVSTGAKKIAVFHQNDAYGNAGLTGVERALAKRNLKVATTATVERNSTDVAAAVKALSAADPDAVVMVSAYKPVAAFVRGMRKAGSVAQLHNLSFVGSLALAHELGDAGNGIAIAQVVPFPWAASVPVVREYQRAMAKAGVTEYSFTSLEGYIAAKVLVEGFKRAGKDLTREKLISALEGMGHLDVGGFSVQFSPSNHNGSRFVELTLIGRGGKFLR